jgi:hypothetical protein
MTAGRIVCSVRGALDTPQPIDTAILGIGRGSGGRHDITRMYTHMSVQTSIYTTAVATHVYTPLYLQTCIYNRMSRQLYIHTAVGA